MMDEPLARLTLNPTAECRISCRSSGLFNLLRTNEKMCTNTIFSCFLESLGGNFLFTFFC